MSKSTHRLKLKKLCSSIIIALRKFFNLNFKRDDDETVAENNIYRKMNCF